MEFNSVEDYVMNAGSNRNAAVLNALLGSEPGMKELPDSPTVDGTYNLQNSVSSGTSTLSWASGGSSGGGVLVVHGTTVDDVTTLDKTWQEIVDAGFSVFYTYDSERGVTYINSIVGYVVDGETPETPPYLVYYGNDLTFFANSPNDYPNDYPNDDRPR